MTDEPKQEPTPSHYLQALDRVHVASLYLQTVFEDDPVLARHPELMKRYEVAVESLEALYQDIGQFDETWE